MLLYLLIVVFISLCFKILDDTQIDDRRDVEQDKEEKRGES